MYTYIVAGRHDVPRLEGHTQTRAANQSVAPRVDRGRNLKLFTLFVNWDQAQRVDSGRVATYKCQLRRCILHRINIRQNRDFGNCVDSASQPQPVCRVTQK